MIHSGKWEERTQQEIKRSVGEAPPSLTHIWIIVHSRDQMVNEGLQGPGHQGVVMVVEPGVALVLALVQVLVVAAGVLPRQRRCLRHVVLQGERGRDEQTGT